MFERVISVLMKMKLAGPKRVEGLDEAKFDEGALEETVMEKKFSSRMAARVFEKMAGPERVQVLKDKYPELAKYVDYFAGSDPTDGKQKYLQWMVNQFRKFKDELEPVRLADKLVSVVWDFAENIKRVKEKDINRYKTFTDLDDAIYEAQEEFEQEMEAAKPKLVHEDGANSVWEVETREQMCSIGKGSGWCVADPTGSYWDKYAEMPGGEYLLVESRGNKYLAFLVDSVIAEIKDWKNNENPYAAELLIRLGLAESYNPSLLEEYGDDDEEDDEERWERFSELAEEQAKEDWSVDRDKIISEAEDLFDNYMEEVGESDKYIQESWDPFEDWAEKELDKYPGEEEWYLEWEGQDEDSISGWYVGQREIDDYAVELLEKYLIEELGWIGPGGTKNRDEEYMMPWQELEQGRKRLKSSVYKRMEFLKSSAGPELIPKLQKKYPDMADEVQLLGESDPTGGKQKYLQWMVSQLRKGEKPGAVVEWVTLYHEHAKWISKDHKDIGRIKTLDDLSGVVEMAMETAEQGEVAKKPNLIHEGEDYRLWEIESKAQMCAVGRGSDWCVANPEGSYWEQYSERDNSRFILVEEFGSTDNLGGQPEKYLAFLIDRTVVEIKDWKDNEDEDAAEYLFDAGVADNYDPDADEEEYNPTIEGTLMLYIGYDSFLDEYDYNKDELAEMYDLPEEVTPEMEDQMDKYGEEVRKEFLRDLERSGFTVHAFSDTGDGAVKATVEIISEDAQRIFDDPNYTREESRLHNKNPGGIARYSSMDEYQEYHPTGGPDWAAAAVDIFVRFDMDSEYIHW